MDKSASSSPLGRSADNSPRPQKRSFYRSEVDSSDEEDEETDELVTGFDKFGVQRCVFSLALGAFPEQIFQLTQVNFRFKHRLNEKPKAAGPLVIPALQNRDWREVARKRKSSSRFVPGAGQVATGADGSVGGLGTRDTINSGPVMSGLQVRKKIKLEEDGMDVEAKTEDTEAVLPADEVVKEEETEEQRAIKALLSGNDGSTEPIIDDIPISETDALRQDVLELPDESTLEDYERVPIDQFGAALLRGMGWKEGTAASRKGTGIVEPYLPEARPALLGIGAKEQEVYDDGSSKKGKGTAKRPERRYVPVIKQERRRDEGSRDSSDSSRRRSPSPRRDRDRDSSRRRDDDRDRHREYERSKDKGRDRDRGHDRDSDKNGKRDYASDRDKDRDRRRDVEDHKDRSRDRRGRDDSDRDRDRGSSRRRD